MRKNNLYHTAGLLIAGFAFFSSAPAQNEKTCGTDHMYEEALKKDPSLAEKRKQLNEFTKQYIASGKSQQSQSVPRVIPTVIHIIHNWGGENISDAQVYSALQIANADLQKMNADTVNVNPPFKPIIGNLNIELRLAQKDPDGNCTNGITRTQSLLTFTADENVKDLIAWDNSKYLNIWVVASISFGAGGYAYYPGTAPPGHEGIVVLHTQFGGIGTACGNNFCDRTLTHELGHYFNLPHTWGNSNSCGDAGNCGIDDGITDTPNTIGNCQSCNINANSCGPLENVENYMDYSTCSKMFTIGQSQVADAALNSPAGYRDNLWQPANLIATGTDGTPLPPCIPIAYFRENSRLICEGDSVRFTDHSHNATVTSWNWSFPGGTPSSSTAQNPTITYSTPGVYSVSLIAGTSSGTSFFTKNNHIIVSTTAAQYSNWQFYEGFDIDPLPSSDWVINDTNGITWQSGAVFFSPPSSAYIYNINNNYNDFDELISPSVDLTAVNNPSIRFKVAFAQRDTSKDVLRMFVSSDCGKTWYLRYAQVGANLATVPAQNTPFLPNSVSQWRTETVALTNFATETNVRFKFQFYSRGGNNIYLDDINVSGPLGVNENGNSFGLSVYPNPSAENSTIGFILPSPEKVSLKVTDVLGREVLHVEEKEMSAGKQELEINTSALEKGVYLITLQVGEILITEKLLVQ